MILKKKKVYYLLKKNGAHIDVDFFPFNICFFFSLHPKQKQNIENDLGIFFFCFSFLLFDFLKNIDFCK